MNKKLNTINVIFIRQGIIEELISFKKSKDGRKEAVKQFIKLIENKTSESLTEQEKNDYIENEEFSEDGLTILIVESKV